MLRKIIKILRISNKIFELQLRFNELLKEYLNFTVCFHKPLNYNEESIRR